MRLLKVKVSQDLFDDTWVVAAAEDTMASSAPGASQGICKIHFSNEARPGASGEAAEIVVLNGIGA